MGMNVMLEALEPQVEAIWRTVNRRLFHPRTSLFYDFVSSYDEHTRFDHLPTPDEIGRQLPNTNGWATGMEDSTITAGVLLAAMCDRYDATGDLDGVRPDARRIFAGLRLCGTLSDREGFILRSVSPQDGKSHYIETSRDQLTHFAHGLWRYYQSPLSDEEERASMRRMIASLCRRLERYIVSERDFHFCMEDDEPGLVDTMWNVMPHEVGRLPMIYAVGWRLTGDGHWYDLYHAYVSDALHQAGDLDLAIYDSCYALFQHQVSMEVLASVPDQDSALGAPWRDRMRSLAESIGSRYTDQLDAYQSVDVTHLDMNWRTRPARELPETQGSAYGKVAAFPAAMRDHEFRPLRESGESLLIRLMDGRDRLSDADVSVLTRALTEVDYGRTFTYAMCYPLAAYWRYRANRSRRP